MLLKFSQDDEKVSLDITEMETLFQTKTVSKEEEVAKPDSTPKKSIAITLIDRKKTTNCAIMLSQFKIPFSVTLNLPLK